MEIEIKMPDLGTNEDEIKVVRWLIEPGQAVGLGDELLEVETDKATMTVESVAQGVLKEIKVSADEKAQTGQVIAILETADSPAGPVTPAPVPPAPASSNVSSESPLPDVDRSARPRRAGSMFARNREVAARDAARSDKSEYVPITTTQRIVGQRLQRSQLNAPHFYLGTSLNAEPMIRAREAQPEEPAVWDAFVVKAVAAALAAYPRMRCRIEGDRFVRRQQMSVGVAVDVDDDVFVIPINDPGSQDVGAISREVRVGVERIRRGNSQTRKLQPADITITNLGSEGVDTFLPIINPPEASILSLGTIQPVVVAEGDQIKIQRRANLNLAVDHRIVNGKYAARFLKKIIEHLETL